MAQHLEGNDTLSGLQVSSILKSGETPLFIVLERHEKALAASMSEIFWIEVFRRSGAPLENAQAFEGYTDRAVRKQALRGEGRELSRIEQAVAIANGRPSRDGRRWSRKETAMMRRLKGEGRSEHQIADVLGRSVGAIRTKLGLPAQE